MDFLIAFRDDLCLFFNQYVVTPFLAIDWRDILDILILATVLYQVYKFASKRRAGRVLLGLLAVVLISVLVSLLDFPAMKYIVSLFASAAFFCFVLIFQPEIRDALERIGNSRAVNPLSDTLPRKRLKAAKEVADQTVDAVFSMSKTCTGALIVFEGLTPLGEYAEKGKLVDARVTSHLLQNIFFDKAPLHDGALIIRDMKIWTANCVLPSTGSSMDFGNMGMRHRAAVGVTEVSDALVVVVSEQTGTVSVAQDGQLFRNPDRETLTDILMTYMAGSLYLKLKKQDAKAARDVSELTAMAERKAALFKKNAPQQPAEETSQPPTVKPVAVKKKLTSEKPVQPESKPAPEAAPSESAGSAVQKCSEEEPEGSKEDLQEEFFDMQNAVETADESRHDSADSGLA